MLWAALCVACSPDPGPRDGFDARRFDGGDPDRTAVIDVSDASIGNDVPVTIDVQVFDARLDAAALDSSADASSADVGTMICVQLSETYAMLVRDSQTCSVAGDCGSSVCETLCCSCYVYVNPMSRDYPSLARLRSEWASHSCPAMMLCPPTPCDPPVAAECTTSGHCTTLRRPGGLG